MRRFLYKLSEEELWNLGIPVEIVRREGEEVVFATYEPLEGLKPVKEEEVLENWESWREGFGPIDVGKIVVLPPWKKVVFIKPGMAFGTGLHPSTKLCLRAIQEMLRKGDSVLDVGTGSGILAIASKLLGAGRVLAVDISEEAVRECGENARINGVSIECRKGRARDINERFDLVVANLEISVFKEEIGDLVKVSKGRLVLSGLYGEGDLEVLKGLLRKHKLRIRRIYEEENWFSVGVEDGRD